jgi:hypothetical protein
VILNWARKLEITRRERGVSVAMFDELASVPHEDWVMDHPCRYRQRFSPFIEAVNGDSTAHDLKGILERSEVSTDSRRALNGWRKESAR